MIQDEDAVQEAVSWHEGQDTALFAFAATGSIDREGMKYEIAQALALVRWDNKRLKGRLPDFAEYEAGLLALDAYVDAYGDRGPVANWGS
jgi:hypothetical protein